MNGTRILTLFPVCSARVDRRTIAIEVEVEAASVSVVPAAQEIVKEQTGVVLLPEF